MTRRPTPSPFNEAKVLRELFGVAAQETAECRLATARLEKDDTAIAYWLDVVDYVKYS